MILAAALMVSLSDDPVILNNNSAHHRIGAGITPAFGGQFQGQFHVLFIIHGRNYYLNDQTNAKKFINEAFYFDRILDCDGSVVDDSRATYAIFNSHNKEIDKQDKIVEMQENIRVAMDILSREVMMAGYNPTKAAGIVGITYSTTQLHIQSDLNSDIDANDPNETITYAFDEDNSFDLPTLLGNGDATALLGSGSMHEKAGLRIINGSVTDRNGATVDLTGGGAYDNPISTSSFYDQREGMTITTYNADMVKL